ncbi:MAG: hypothetical protein JXJ17_05665 [Anaerolineae bacterium]|nr:hypothetical protein [Anaerolineae bacterium]
MESRSKTEQGRRTALIIVIVVVALLVAAVVCALVVVALSGGLAFWTLAQPVPTEGVVVLPPTVAATVTPEVLIEVAPTPTASPEPTVEVEPTATEGEPVDELIDPVDMLIVLDSYDLDISEDSDFDVAEIYWRDFGLNVSDEPVCHVKEIIARALFYELEVYVEFDLVMGSVTGYITGGAEIIRDDCGHSLDSGEVYIWGDFTGRVEPVGNKWEFSGEDGYVEVLFDQVRVNCPAECNPGTSGPTTDIFAEASEGMTLPIDFEGSALGGSDAGTLAIWAGDDDSGQWLTVVHTHDATYPLPWGEWPPVP